MPSTDELLGDFKTYLAMGFSIPNARRAVERKVSGTRQLERLRNELDRWIAETGEDDEVAT